MMIDNETMELLKSKLSDVEEGNLEVFIHNGQKFHLHNQGRMRSIDIVEGVYYDEWLMDYAYDSLEIYKEYIEEGE